MRVLNPITSALLLALASANVQAMSITEAVQSAVDYHPQVSSNRNSKLSADEDVKFARGGYYPSVDLVAGYGRQRSDNTTTRAEGNHNKETLNYTQSELRLRQMIFDGFNTSNEVGRTEAVSTSRAYYTQAVAQDVALRAVEVYLEVLKRRELVTLARNNLQAHLRVNDQIGLRNERGVGSTADLDQSRARRALAENNLDTAEVDLADAEANFFSVVGRMPDELESPQSIKGEVPGPWTKPATACVRTTRTSSLPRLTSMLPSSNTKWPSRPSTHASTPFWLPVPTTTPVARKATTTTTGKPAWR